jgi:hypothetical protein
MMYGNPFNHNFVCSCLHPLFPLFATPCHLALITETPYFCLADFFDSCLWGLGVAEGLVAGDGGYDVVGGWEDWAEGVCCDGDGGSVGVGLPHLL